MAAHKNVNESHDLSGDPDPFEAISKAHLWHLRIPLAPPTYLCLSRHKMTRSYLNSAQNDFMHKICFQTTVVEAWFRLQQTSYEAKSLRVFFLATPVFVVRLLEARCIDIFLCCTGTCIHLDFHYSAPSLAGRLLPDFGVISSTHGVWHFRCLEPKFRTDSYSGLFIYWLRLKYMMPRSKFGWNCVSDFRGPKM